VLKVGLAELPREAAVLRAWDGQGAARLLRAMDGALPAPTPALS
jgi:streptomycin 6-kinase